MENEGFKLFRFRGVSLPSQLISLVIYLSAYVSHLHFLKISFEFSNYVVALKELGVMDLKNLAYLFGDDLGIASVSNPLSANLFG